MDNTTSSETLSELLHHYYKEALPFLPTYFFLILSSVVPIYTGAHASLHRPVSAARPPKQKNDDDDDALLEVRVEEETSMVQGLERSDVVLYPLIAGATLAGLYWLITYLEETAVALLTALLNAYMSIFGLAGIFAFLSDGMEVLASFVFPSRYLERDADEEKEKKEKEDGSRHQQRLWVVDGRRRLVQSSSSFAKTGETDAGETSASIARRTSPLPSALGRSLLKVLPDGLLWGLRDLATRPAFVIELQVYKLITKVRPTPLRVMSAQVAIGAILYYNLVDRAWWLTNLLGFSFTYSAFQILSPTNFQIGTALLSALLCYDIYMVFFTPMMITVATKLDIPAKIMIPNPDMEGKRAFSMLGLGDIVIPGMMMALALRFDLYMFYLKRQKVVQAAKSSVDKEADYPAIRSNSSKRYLKQFYKKATGVWGDSFWLGSRADDLSGGGFPKTYFWASIIGYIIGLLVTLMIVMVFEHGQPALLYLVPGVLGSLWMTALVRGEAHIMWKYTEDPDEGRKAGIDSAVILGNDDLLSDHSSLGLMSYEQTYRTRSKTEGEEKEESNDTGLLKEEGMEKGDDRNQGDSDPPSKKPGTEQNGDRCVFKLVVSLPPRHRHLEESQKTVKTKLLKPDKTS